MKKIGNGFRNDTDTLEPIEEIRRDMLERLIETEEGDSKEASLAQTSQNNEGVRTTGTRR